MSSGRQAALEFFANLDFSRRIWLAKDCFFSNFLSILGLVTLFGLISFMPFLIMFVHYEPRELVKVAYLIEAGRLVKSGYFWGLISCYSASRAFNFICSLIFLYHIMRCINKTSRATLSRALSLIFTLNPLGLLTVFVIWEVLLFFANFINPFLLGLLAFVNYVSLNYIADCLIRERAFHFWEPFSRPFTLFIKAPWPFLSYLMFASLVVLILIIPSAVALRELPSPNGLWPISMVISSFLLVCLFSLYLTFLLGIIYKQAKARFLLSAAVRFRH